MADTKTSALTALGAVPDILDLIPLVDTSASATRSVTAAYLRSLAGQAITASGSHALAPLQAFVFTDTTARALTFTGAPAYGWLLIIAAQATATSHTAKLPAGVTYNGTDNTATLDGAGDVLILLATSATRYLVLYNNSVTFSTT
jgi:hypothetical protein